MSIVSDKYILQTILENVDRLYDVTLSPYKKQTIQISVVRFLMGLMISYIIILTKQNGVWLYTILVSRDEIVYTRITILYLVSVEKCVFQLGTQECLHKTSCRWTYGAYSDEFEKKYLPPTSTWETLT